MRVITRDEYEPDKPGILSLIREGVVFIYPTDTIYGIGCDATDPEAVARLRSIKQRYDKPFSVIVPSKQWIKDNCEVPAKAKEWLDKLPGPYTLILKLKNKKAVCSQVNNDEENVGIRMPNHWIKEVAERLGTPIVTTSANITGRDFMTSLDDLDDEIANNVDFILYEGEKKARPSQIVDLTHKDIKIIAR